MRAARVDANQSYIVAALRRVGVTVFPTHMVGGGFPDLVAGCRGKTFLLEIKDGKKPPSARKLTKDEQRFADSWQGHIAVVTSAEEAIAICLNP